VTKLKDEHPAWGNKKIAVLASGENRELTQCAAETIYRRLRLGVLPAPEARIAEPRDAVRRATRPNEIWACDITETRDLANNPLQWFAVIDEKTRECLCLEVNRAWSGEAVARCLSQVAEERGFPFCLRTDNAKLWQSRSLTAWMTEHSVAQRLIRNGAPWQNGVVESFFSQLRRELLDLAEFYDLVDANGQANVYREVYNNIRPHGAIGYTPPTVFSNQWRDREE
jgi:transposase InsO family protein